MAKSKFTKAEERYIKKLARGKLVEYMKLNDVIGHQIFSILNMESRVVYYPFEDQQVWGFSETVKGIPFVCINTSLSYDKQVFAAAHELYHIWFGRKADIILSETEEEIDEAEDTEKYASRFAAEFLVNEELLYQEMDVYGVDSENIEIKDVLKLADIFVVPYRTMVKRLYETGNISENEEEKLEDVSEKELDIWKRRLGISVPDRRDFLSLGNLTDKAVSLYERNLITYEKLEYLLGLSDISPVEMGIRKKREYVPCSDDELDRIMEE